MPQGQAENNLNHEKLFFEHKNRSDANLFHSIPADGREYNRVANISYHIDNRYYLKAKKFIEDKFLTTTVEKHALFFDSFETSLEKLTFTFSDPSELEVEFLFKPRFMQT